jgi:hypothetical protein
MTGIRPAVSHASSVRGRKPVTEDAAHPAWNDAISSALPEQVSEDAYEIQSTYLNSKKHSVPK